MSTASANSFIDRMASDQDFYNKVVARHDAEARMAFAVSEGFEFTPQEMQEALETRKNEELTDAELELISGAGYNDVVECSFLPPCKEGFGDCKAN